MFANCRSQFLLDSLGRCLYLSVSSDSTFCHEFTFQSGLAIFLFAKNFKNLGARTQRTATVVDGGGVSVFASVSGCARACVRACVRDVFAIYDKYFTQADNDNN